MDRQFQWQNLYCFTVYVIGFPRNHPLWTASTWKDNNCRILIQNQLMNLRLARAETAVYWTKNKKQDTWFCSTPIHYKKNARHNLCVEIRSPAIWAYSSNLSRQIIIFFGSCNINCQRSISIQEDIPKCINDFIICKQSSFLGMDGI